MPLSEVVIFQDVSVRDRLRVGWRWEGYCESRRCSRDTHPESYITEYTMVYEEKMFLSEGVSVLDLRTTASQNCEAVPRRARI